jgi:ubiquinone/menaquinone biosynthesis C-methylase UbiE
LRLPALLRVRSTASEPKTNRFWAATAILYSSQALSRLTLSALPGVAAPIMQRSKPSLGVDLHEPLGNLRGAIGLLGWRQSPFPKALMGDERIGMPHNPWQHAIGNVIVAPGTERRPPRSTFRGVATTPSYSTKDIRSFFDQCASTGSPEEHGHAPRLLEYRLELVRSLARPHPADVVLDLGCGNGHHLLALGPKVARGIGIDISPRMIELARARLRISPWTTNLTFEVDDAEELQEIADQSIDLAICIGALEHMLDKRAVLASIYRVLKFGGRFFCLTLNANYVWYRTIAPRLGFATKHLSSDRMLNYDEFVVLLDKAGFRSIRFAPWTFIPKGDVRAFVALLLTVLDAMGRHVRLDSLRGGLSLCAWKQAEST